MQTNCPVYVARANHTDGNSSDASQPVPTAMQRERSAKQLPEQVQELQVFLKALPDLDQRSAEEILGYNAYGIPE
jgi:hypothetical protein